MAVAAAPLLAEKLDVPRDWLDELQEASGRPDLLTPAVRAALVAVVDAFAAEDGFLHPTALRARVALTGALARRTCGIRLAHERSRAARRPEER